MKILHSATAIRQLSPRARITLIGCVTIMFAVVGIMLLASSRANTGNIHVEAETGTLGGNAYVINPAYLASGGKSVSFGVPPETRTSTPTNLRAMTGGNSIGLVWYARFAGPNWQFEVYRNDVKIATTRPDPNMAGTKLGTQYIDRSIVTGQKYTYRVKAISDTTGPSSLSNGVTVTAPAPTPLPNVVIENNVNQNIPELTTWFQQYAVPALKDWYPKMAAAFATPGYIPPQTIIIRSPAANDPMWSYNERDAAASTNVIYVHPDKFGYSPGGTGTKDLVRAGGVVIHEAAHVLQYYDNGYFNPPPPRWITEGIATVMDHYVYNWRAEEYNYFQRAVKPTNSYNDSYGYSAAFMMWIQSKYDPDYIRKVNVAARLNKFTSAFYEFPGGRSIDDLWNEFAGSTHKVGPIKSRSDNSKCAGAKDNKLGEPGALVPLVVVPCSGSPLQKLALRTAGGSSNEVYLDMLGQCLVNYPPAFSSEQDWRVDMWQCGGSGRERWQIRADGTIYNIEHKRCLAAKNNSFTNDNRLVTLPCSSSAALKWNTP